MGNDIIEIGHASANCIHDESLVVKMRHIDKTSGSARVYATWLSLSGKEQKLCEMFTAPAVIKARPTGNTGNVILSHLAAKIVFNRPTGTAWFTCRKGYEVAIGRATRVKDQWGKTFLETAGKYCSAKLCLDPDGKCLT